MVLDRGSVVTRWLSVAHQICGCGGIDVVLDRGCYSAGQVVGGSRMKI